MERSRYSIKPNAGKGLSGFITNFNVAGEFDPAWLDSNPDFLGADLLFSIVTPSIDNVSVDLYNRQLIQ